MPFFVSQKVLDENQADIIALENTVECLLEKIHYLGYTMRPYVRQPRWENKPLVINRELLAKIMTTQPLPMPKKRKRGKSGKLQ